MDLWQTGDRPVYSITDRSTADQGRVKQTGVLFGQTGLLYNRPVHRQTGLLGKKPTGDRPVYESIDRSIGPMDRSIFHFDRSAKKKTCQQTSAHACRPVYESIDRSVAGCLFDWPVDRSIDYSAIDQST